MLKKEEYICINCGCETNKLYKEYSPTAIKTVRCNKCHHIADKYIEFELIIALLDALLLSKKAFRHMIYNRGFKINWKLSLILLLLDSFSLWQRTSKIVAKKRHYGAHDEMGFYIAMLKNMIDYLIIVGIWLSLSFLLHKRDFLKKPGLKAYFIILLKAVALGNLSKFFILPIMIWRTNATELASIINHILIFIHHLCALCFTFTIVCPCDGKLATILVISTFMLKEYFKSKTYGLMHLYLY